MRRIVLVAIALAALAQVAVPLAFALRPLLEGGAVLALALAGLWLMVRTPFRHRL